MDTSPSFTPAKRRRLHKRSSNAASPPSTDVTIVSVTVTEDGTATWRFTAGVSVFPDTENVAGLTIAGASPNNVIVLTGDGFILSYDAPVVVGDPWVADEALGAIDVVFDGGGDLAMPESGNVV